MKKWKDLTNKTKYYITNTLSYILLLVPILVYSICNVDKLTKNNVIGLSLAGFIILSLVLLAVLVKIKVKAGVWLCIVAIVLLVMQDITAVLGYGLLCVGGGLILSEYIMKPITEHYKEAYYKDEGKTITYSKNID